jgi:CBS domain-containing protein
MLPPASIKETATVDEAFRLMHARHLSGLYVVDDNGRPTGYLDLLEVSLRYLEALEASPPAAD